MAENGKLPYDYGMPEDEGSRRSGSAYSADSRQSRQANMSQQEIDQLVNDVKNIGLSVAREVGKGINEVAGTIRENGAKAARAARNSVANDPITEKYEYKLAAYEAKRIARQQKLKVERMVSTSGSTFWGVAFAFLTVGAAVALAAEFSASALVLGAVTGFASAHFFHKTGMKKRLRRYLLAMGNEEVIPLRRLAEVTRNDESFVKKDLSGMIRKGWLTDGYIDDEEGLFFVSAEKYRALQRKQEAEKRLEVGAADSREPQQEENIQQMKDFLMLLEEHITAASGDVTIWNNLKRLDKAAREILEWVKKHPDSMNRSRRLTSYYMPTTLKLLRTYDDIKNQPGEAADNIRREIADALDRLGAGFEKLRDALLSDMALDVSGEIGAMETMLAQDGLTESNLTL